jgi:hypothetical protein
MLDYFIMYKYQRLIVAGKNLLKYCDDSPTNVNCERHC